jgi:hypothetical protein
MDSSPPLAVLTILRNKARVGRAVVVQAARVGREDPGGACAWVPRDVGGMILSSSSD